MSKNHPIKTDEIFDILDKVDNGEPAIIHESEIPREIRSELKKQYVVKPDRFGWLRILSRRAFA